MNPPTAYRMLKDFAPFILEIPTEQPLLWEELSFCQLCRSWGVKTVNLVRSRDDLAAVVEDLKSLGADLVITEEHAIRDKFLQFQKRRKGRGTGTELRGRSVDDVPGERPSRRRLPRHLRRNEQTTTSAGPLIFKDIKLADFLMTRWYGQKVKRTERDEMLNDLGRMLKEGSLVPPKCEAVRLKDCQQALETAATSFAKKQLFVMD